MLEEKIKKESKIRKFHIQKIYIKDVSFESPYAPKIFKKTWNPKISCDLNTISDKLEENLFEVVLRVTVKVNIERKLVFLCEVNQAGIFYIQGIKKIELPHCLNAYCPSILFPYVRENISSLTSKGGFPQLNLEPVNFDLAFSKIQSKNDLKD
ncbi:protein-export chaperone SecB [Buchnera aphidicola]|uniref:protein-export chaperone SecB n=1 Tax=Buchnera aphidicola TaxID=9 RepID=UPI0022387E43|nr:protein-export chaperone SecB [Buchnera aphidicola]MCW5197384.1 protein-export chaperone SecB [Buchnera aphidicola (Chaitophorus viminalis)]